MQKKHISQTHDSIIAKTFGLLADGKEVFAHTLCNGNGIEMDVINYGATITALKIPLSGTTKVDVVLGFENITDYVYSFGLPNAPYFGTIVGRYAGRINHAKFTLNNQTIQLTKNHKEHQLHGGHEGFSQAFWEVLEINSNENPSITLQYISDDNEENFPGMLTTQVTYTLTESNELKVSFLAKSNADTIVNLTQHSYFNLDGHTENISNQGMYVNASQILDTTSENIPTGKFVSLANHPFNFSAAKQCPAIIDNTFVLDQNKLPQAILYSKKNNLKMSVFTDQPALHIYVGGNCFGQIKGKANADYHNASGICFEAQNFPDAPNHPNFPSAVLKKGETYTHHTTFKFENL
jgi:aldose 1-epimerase